MKTNSRWAFRVAVIATLFVSVAARADVDWTQFECTFNVKFNGYRGSAPIENFPVLVRLSRELNELGMQLTQPTTRCRILPHERQGVS